MSQVYVIAFLSDQDNSVVAYWDGSTRNDNFDPAMIYKNKPDARRDLRNLQGSYPNEDLFIVPITQTLALNQFQLNIGSSSTSGSQSPASSAPESSAPPASSTSPGSSTPPA